jgi:hypothetical protein
VISILLSNWKLVLIALLTAALALAGNLLLKEREDHVATKTEYRLNLDEAEKARKEVQDRSDSALKKLNDEHTINIRKAKDNAYRNFLARYGDSICVLPQPAAPRSDQADPAGGSETSDGTATERMASFATDCAIDAGTVKEFQRWVRLNRLLVEGE